MLNSSAPICPLLLMCETHNPAAADSADYSKEPKSSLPLDAGRLTDMNEKVEKPSKYSISVIRQFARSYRVESSLPIYLSSYIAN